MNAVLQGNGERMRQQTERFLSRAVRTVRDPREVYLRLIRNMRRSPSQRLDKVRLARSAA